MAEMKQNSKKHLMLSIITLLFIDHQRHNFLLSKKYFHAEIPF